MPGPSRDQDAAVFWIATMQRGAADQVGDHLPGALLVAPDNGKLGLDNHAAAPLAEHVLLFVHDLLDRGR